MNKYWKYSVIVYLAAVIFMFASGKWIINTVYEDLAVIVNLLLFITGAVLAGKSDGEEIKVEELEELEQMILERINVLRENGHETGSV